MRISTRCATYEGKDRVFEDGYSRYDVRRNNNANDKDGPNRYAVQTTHKLKFAVGLPLIAAAGLVVLDVQYFMK